MESKKQQKSWLAKLLRILTPLFFVIALAAVLSRIILSIPQSGLYVLGYFTLQSNLMVIIWLAGDWLSKGGWSEKRPWLHDALLVYIGITGLVYNLLLAGLWNPQGWDLVIETINHTVTPLFFFLRWLFTRESQRPAQQKTWACLIYPAAYSVFGMVEGSLTGKFRYFFLDFEQRSLGDFLIVFGGVTVAFVGIAWGLRGIRYMQKTAKAKG
jgi:hypothetical protein